MRYIGENEIDFIGDPQEWIAEHQRPEPSDEGINQIMAWAISLNARIKDLEKDFSPRAVAEKEQLAAQRETVTYTLKCVFPPDPVEGLRSELPDYWKIRFQAELRARIKELGSIAMGK